MESTVYTDYDLPSYNIKAVAQMVGLLPVTLRAWERRYGLPSPSRGGQGYRLYSEHDLQTLRWLKQQLESGMNIGQAAQRLHQLLEAKKDPTSAEFIHNEHSLTMTNLQSQLESSLRSFNSSTAAEALHQALNTYVLEDVFSNLIEPILIKVGEEWHRGEISVAEEHFATEFFQEQLLSILSGTVKPFRSGTILAGCMPGEQHQIGLIMLVILLRMRGWNVIYMGPNLLLDRLDEVIQNLNPRLILFSATLPETAARVNDLVEVMKKIDKPSSTILLGGQGFKDLSGKMHIPHPIMSGTRAEMINTMEKLIEQNNKH
jgi:MerR family transcriptional regulator, light-induced transcriptional regulator